MKFTTKSDTYSFGVILAVLVMGKFPNDEFFQDTDETSLVEWLHNVMSSGDPTRAIHPSLLGNGHEEQMLLVLRIACVCTVTEPEDRPSRVDATEIAGEFSRKRKKLEIAGIDRGLSGWDRCPRYNSSKQIDIFGYWKQRLTTMEDRDGVRDAGKDCLFEIGFRLRLLSFCPKFLRSFGGDGLHSEVLRRWK
ncbi:uncharacterized protein A4U43_C10F15490 [Asparagus officinalis]|uniref:Protein kinase domain-containing protein n=1 Tax=Asparagus officinalis TaxID=4686 RepID=A0A5P1E398_ASPOF|nr:uncharacterized protein A4U43_C10F15490 [Asparagus officinalis]